MKSATRLNLIDFPVSEVRSRTVTVEPLDFHPLFQIQSIANETPRFAVGVGQRYSRPKKGTTFMRCLQPETERFSIRLYARRARRVANLEALLRI